jgi:hypothetical protein
VEKKKSKKDHQATTRIGNATNNFKMHFEMFRAEIEGS